MVLFLQTCYKVERVGVCMAGLRRAAGPEIKINDISDYLVQAYCGQGIEGSRKEEPVSV